MKFSLPGAHGNLFFSVLAANTATVTIGTHYSWSSPSVPKLQAADSWLPIDSDQASWITSLVSLGTVFSPFLAGWLINLVGRRFTMLLSVVISSLAWIIMLFSTTVWQIYIGQFVGGIGGGLSFLAVPTYVAEISEPAVRGALGALFTFSLVGGYIIEYCIGPYVTYTVLIIINFIPAVVFLSLYPLLPESPVLYLRKGNTPAAMASLSWLRKCKHPKEVENELMQIQNEVRTSLGSNARLWDLVSTHGARMGLLISLVMVSGQQLSGCNVVLFYGETIFKMAGTTFSSSISTIIIGLLLFICGGFAPPLSQLFGIKNVLIFSAIGMTIFQTILGLYFYFYSSQYDMTSFSWLPLLGMICYISTYTVGFGPLPWAVMAEMFQSNVKGLASAITASFCWLLSFLLTKFFTNVTESLGSYVPFLFFAVCCALVLIFTIFVLPDTRGMTLQEILDLLNRKPIEFNYVEKPPDEVV